VYENILRLTQRFGVSAPPFEVATMDVQKPQKKRESDVAMANLQYLQKIVLRIGRGVWVDICVGSSFHFLSINDIEFVKSGAKDKLETNMRTLSEVLLFLSFC
jgi:hypothetical protein